MKACAAGVALGITLWAPVLPAETSGGGDRSQAGPESVTLPASVPDPLEPFNRAMWALNRELMKDVVKPTSRLYRFVVRKPLRTGIANFGRNITYPGRLLNNLLQGRWHGAQDETHRFFCNTIAGGAGFVDIATLWRIPKSDADFGQTLGSWGWRPGCYLMLPVFGPSNERDALGLMADSAANPMTYITPYSITTRNPLTFFSPYMYFSYTVIYIIPGLGSHRLTANALALAELVYRNGYSAVCVSSPYNPEFMTQAATAAMPAYSPVDSHDLHRAVTKIDQQLQRKYPHRLGARAVMGYSMGGFQALFMVAASATNQPPLLEFARCVAIDTPVRLTYGISKLDELYNAPLAWPAEQRTSNIENTFLKLASSGQGSLTPQSDVPLDEIESMFLIGLAYRLVLRDVIFNSQLRTNQGILRQPLRKLRREPAYREIGSYSYRAYFQKFAVPYYQQRGIDLARATVLEAAGDLRSHARPLQENRGLRVIVNENDFLLSPEDLAWLRATFGPERLTVFEHGGHLGNLGQPEVQNRILQALEGM